MNLPDILRHVEARVQRNSPEILTALGVSGVVTTSYLSAKAGYATAHLLDGEPPNLTFKEKVVLTWRLYIPTAASGALTIASVVYASRTSGRRAAAAVTAYSLTERAFSEYREKVVEQMGEVKEQKLRDELRQKQVLDSPSKEVIVLGGGDVLCCELFTHRYFRSDMETLRRAQNEINSQINNTYNVALDDFYDVIGLPHTSVSSNIGWDSDKLMELEFSTVLSGSGEPCLAFDYNYTKPLK
jgi:hypothetical protein